MGIEGKKGDVIEEGDNGRERRKIKISNEFNIYNYLHYI